MKRLIINADDFGLTAMVNQAIIDTHSCGLLRSTSLLANGEAFASAVDLARQAPGLGVGVHLNFTEGQPVAPASSVPSLVNGQGFFARKPASLWQALISGRVSTVDVEKELRAQIEKVLAAGVAATHLDSHKHVHTLPALGRMTIRLARQYGIPAIRGVAESWSGLGCLLRRFPHARRAIFRQRLNSLTLAAVSCGWRRRLRRAGVACARNFYGLTPTGFLDEHILREILCRLPDGTSELMCHPGFVDEALRQTPTRLLEQRELEYQALTQPGIKLLAKELGIQFINYAELVQAQNAGGMG